MHLPLNSTFIAVSSMASATSCVLFCGNPFLAQSAAKELVIDVGVKAGATALTRTPIKPATLWQERNNPITPCLEVTYDITPVPPK